MNRYVLLSPFQRQLDDILLRLNVILFVSLREKYIFGVVQPNILKCYYAPERAQNSEVSIRVSSTDEITDILRPDTEMKCLEIHPQRLILSSEGNETRSERA